MKQSPFGRHLSSQIIWPLILVSVLIGIVATVVSAGVLGDFTRTIGEENARTTAEYVIADLNHHASSSVRALEVLAARPGFVNVVMSGEAEEIEGHLRFSNEAIDVDMIVVTDGEGEMVASVSREAGPADVSLPDRAAWESAMSDEKPVVIPYNDGYALWSQADIPVSGHSGWALGSVLEIDDDLLASLAVSERSGILITDMYERPIALLRPYGEATPDPDIESDAGFKAVIDELIADPSTSVTYESPTGYYRIAADTIPLATAPGEHLYVVCGVDASPAREASMTTTRFVIAWSAVAILVLIVLNWWVVRSVTTPLNALTAGTRRLAEGDFTAKVDVGGPVEVTELAENFNSMTDSLSERSDSLTKKVLELATLYEMSRSLGLTLDLTTLLNSVLDSALRIFEAEIGYIIMLDRESGALSVEAVRGVGSGRSGEVTGGNSMSEWVIREGRPLIFNPSGTDPVPRRPETFSGAHAALCVPLQTADGPIGSVTIGSRDPERRFTSDDVRLLATIANHVTIAIGNIGLFSSVQEAYLATVRALAAAVDAKDPYTRGHSEGVATYALMIGGELGLSQEQMTALEMAAYLHDIGKIGISEDILLKPGKLTDVEMSQMRHHPLIGANILKPVAFPWPIAPVVRHHHEHFDGKGYPAGLKTDEIPALARVLTVADAFEAMVADRPYRRGRSHQEAILELERCAGTQFDPRIVEAFVTALEAREGIPQDLSDREVHIGDDEAQAVFIAIADGLFSSFRRLGGPRLANNLEHAVNADLAKSDLPLAIEGGRLVLRAFEEMSDEEYARNLRDALGIIRSRIEEASGAGLAEHFLSEAVEALPERMRAHAERLGFSPTI
ncbi:MAG: HD domain-containing protein [Coriobacteriia bacterium]|nr:HD domain-containing protein [Coriobacteriia bacterium]MBN2839802.1 HD domain-containing protein [Coriobacteriia bacterium]